MISLLQNEWMKTMKRNRIILFFSIDAVLLLVGAIIVKVAEGRLDYDVAGIDYTRVGLDIFTTILSFYAIVLSASIITSEYKDGTVKQLFIRSYSRTSILLSKFITVALITFVLYFLLITYNFLIGWIVFGYSDVAEVLQLNGTLGLYWLPNILFYITLAFAIGAITRNNGLAMGLTFLAKFSSGAISILVVLYDWGKYIIFPNLSLTSLSEDPLINGGMPAFIEGGTLGFSLLIVSAYVIALVVLSLFVTEKRDVL